MHLIKFNKCHEKNNHFNCLKKLIITYFHLSSIITSLNSNKLQDRIFRRQISSNVEYAFYWKKQPSINDKVGENNSPYNIYLIKNNKKYVGAVLDMIGDLHWFVQVKYRKKVY